MRICHYQTARWSHIWDLHGDKVLWVKILLLLKYKNYFIEFHLSAFQFSF